MLFFFTINNEHIYKCFCKESVFAFTIPFTFSGTMKALVLQLNIYQQLVFKILINTSKQEMQGSSRHLTLQDLN